MSRKERDHLRAEVGSLNKLLAELPESELIERMSLEQRSEEARGRLAELVENGRLIGVSPESRKFECRLEDGSVLSGKLDRTIADAAEFKRQWDEKRARLTFRVVHVRSTARYTLLRADRIDDPLDVDDGATRGHKIRIKDFE